MTLAVMGYHFQVMTQKMSKALEAAARAAEIEEIPVRATIGG
jgi:hypothetical protein